VGDLDARSVLTRSRLGALRYGFTYSVNPYRGCPHACAYCYADSVTRDPRPWGSALDRKASAPQVLARQLRTAARGLVLVSSATDPYPPEEARARITEGCLRALRDAGFPVSVLTRSPLVLRDLQLFRSFPEVEVGLSFTSSRDRPDYEPRVPPVASRLRTLRLLSEAGVPTFASVAPLLPGTTLDDLRSLLGALREAGARAVFVDPLSLSPYPAATRRMRSLGGREFAPGEAEALLGGFESEALRAGLPVHRRLFAWRSGSRPPPAAGPSATHAVQDGGAGSSGARQTPTRVSFGATTRSGPRTQSLMVAPGPTWTWSRRTEFSTRESLPRCTSWPKVT
jgi:DNA repair photolyase